MHKKLYNYAVIVMMLPLVIQAQQKSSGIYRFTVDLIHVNDDKVKVELITPPIKSDSITYYLPKIIPGTYSEDDFGRYIEQLHAFDKKGNELSVTKPDVNSWTIHNAKNVYRLSYLVNDSYDDSITKQVIFEPAGSNIQTDTNYVINNNCFLGYFSDMKNVGYEIIIQHPAGLYGSTALTDVDHSNVADKFVTESYNRAVDSPIMYCASDTTVIKVGNTDVLIAVYSPTKKISSKFLASKLDTLLQDQGKYLGGKLPVDKYAFLIYLDSKPTGYSGGEGALEHSYCSMYYYPERSPEALSTEFVNHAAHEFFHIITPLTIHSEEIQFFDFNNPKMSQHLWLYEGSTEYHAHMVQEKYGIISPEELLNRLSQKITTSKNNYNDTVPLTVMSREILGPYKKQFGNVYQKGALINMCIDIKLLQLSNGKYGIMDLIHALSNEYGKQKGFKDDELFDEISKLTYPEIKTFLDMYVGGNKPLPLQEIFSIVGVTYSDKMETKDSTFSLGHVSFSFNPATKRIFISDTLGMNTLGRQLAYHPNDEVVAINGDTITLATANRFFTTFGSNSKQGDSLVIDMQRKDAAGNYTPITLSATMTKFPVMKYNALSFDENATAAHLSLRNAWLQPK